MQSGNTHSTDAHALFSSPPSSAQQLTSVQQVRKWLSHDLYNLNHIYLFLCGKNECNIVTDPTLHFLKHELLSLETENSLPMR